MNLDGTNAAATFSLPRIELHSGPSGWTCVCHRQNGTSVKLPLGASPSAAAARHAAAEAMLALDELRRGPARPPRPLARVTAPAAPAWRRPHALTSCPG